MHFSSAESNIQSARCVSAAPTGEKNPDDMSSEDKCTVWSMAACCSLTHSHSRTNGLYCTGGKGGRVGILAVARTVNVLPSSPASHAVARSTARPRLQQCVGVGWHGGCSLNGGDLPREQRSTAQLHRVQCSLSASGWGGLAWKLQPASATRGRTW